MLLFYVHSLLTPLNTELLDVRGVGSVLNLFLLWILSSLFQTIKYALRMDYTGERGKIHLPEKTALALKDLNVDLR